MKRRPPLPLVVVVVAAAVAAAGWGVSRLPGDYVVAPGNVPWSNAVPEPAPPPPAPPPVEAGPATPFAVAEPPSPPAAGEGARPLDFEFDRNFRAGVVRLREGRVHSALLAFEAARVIKPHQPEVLVNMGFAYLATGRFADARMNFERALQIRGGQVNAYYGLAGALRGVGDLEGALGAMNVFLHFAAPDHPFQTRAQAAVWELEAELGRLPGPLVHPDHDH